MRAFYLLLFIFCFLVVAACRPAAAPVTISNKPASINDVPQTNVPMPPPKSIENLGWQLFEPANPTPGRLQMMGELKGKVVVLDFWATYCKPCIEGIPHLVELQKTHKDLQVIGLHVGGEEDVAKVPEFAEKLKINYPLGFPDPGLSAALMGDNSAIPQTFVFNREGKLVDKFVGFDPAIKSGLDMAILESLNNSR